MTPSPSLTAYAAAQLAEITAAGLLRSERVYSTAQEPHAIVDDTAVLLAASSNYLGLASDPRLQDAACAAMARYGVGSGGSRLTTGTTALHRAVEAQLAAFLGTEDCVFCATGYQANLAAITTCAGPDTTIFSDALNHASIIDGARLAKASVEVFPHRDYGELRRLLAVRSTPHALVISDGLFSMDGDVADTHTLISTAREYGAWTMLDDAHAIGTLGATGRGSCEGHDLRPDLLIGTASKALGVEGGYICATAEIATLLRNRARSYIYSTAPSPAMLAAVGAAVDILATDRELIARLQARIATLSAGLLAAGVIDRPATTPIIPIPIGAEDTAMHCAAALAEEGILIPAIRYPTVARGQAILRLTVLASYSEADCERIIHALRRSVLPARRAG